MPQPTPAIGQVRKGRAYAVYLAMLLGTVVAFLVIRHFGESTATPKSGAAVAGELVPTSGKSDTLLHVLLALSAVVVAGRIVGGIFQYLGQPPVIGEVIAGLLLGPSCLGHLAPAAQAFILPNSVAPFMGVLAQVGVILYMFVVGLELDTGLLRERAHASVAISHASIVAPFLLGAGLALGLYPILSSPDVPFTVFALFLGAAMSITAFPVLARILTDRGLTKTPLGVLALTCAATDDVTAWCLLAFVVSIAQSRMESAIVVIGMTLCYIAAMFFVVRPILLRLAPHWNAAQPSRGLLAAMLVGLLLSALVTELIGIHAIFGAFLLGAVIPHDSRIAQDLIHKTEDIASVLLLPAFFAFTGMRTEIGLVSGTENWLLCGLIIVVATAGKFGGTLAAARFTGLGWREGSQLGILMNTRGLMELIVLNIGLDLKVISPTLFAMMVIMALVTTTATTPILRMISSKKVGG